ncbi:MAG: sigma-E processing peptidase SpoIIGA [Oscillospiraceae bacterium]|nr:sigma-E processing peptidase SpoIIGA [Oscillospiraceae bacterium]
MVKTVYVDILFIINLIINYLLLFVTAHIATLRISRLRLSLAASFGALYAVLSFFPKLSILTFLPIKLLIAAAMVFLAFGRNHFLRAFLVFFVCSLFLAGLCLLAPSVISSVSGGVYYINISFPVLLLSTLIAYILLRLVFLRRGGGEKKICNVTVKNNGNEISLRALVDTGNSLRAPQTNARVVICAYDTIRCILPTGVRNVLDKHRDKSFSLAFDKLSELARFSLIPCRTVGVSFSLLLAFTPDEVCIEKKISKGAICVISETPVSDGSGYNAII